MLAREIPKRSRARALGLIQTSDKNMSWSLLRKLIREEIEELGKYAFADDRERGYETPEEPDTPAEREAYRQLRLHVTNNIGVDEKTADIVRRAHADGSYSDIFKPPAFAYAYRGLRVPRKFMERFGVEGYHGSADVDYVHIPQKPVESWTMVWNKAVQFAVARGLYNNTGTTSVILVANVSDNEENLIAGVNGLYKLKGLDKHRSEKEYFSLGPIRVSKVVWTDDSVPHARYHLVQPH